MAARTHDPERCAGQYCVVHHPSDHHMREWPVVHRLDRTVWVDTADGQVSYTLTERTCEHGAGHPDPDSLMHARRVGGREFARAQSVHGCCSELCCARPVNQGSDSPGGVAL